MSKGTLESDWRDLLSAMNQLVLECGLSEEVPEDVLKRGWLGEPPAAEEAIAAAELRLGLTLPPSFKAFYRVSNGWHWPHPDVRMILAVEGIERLGDSNNKNIAAFVDGSLYQLYYMTKGHEAAERLGHHAASELGLEVAAELLPPDDPLRNVAAMVEISLEEPPMSEALMLLDPTNASADGEMQVLLSSNWTVGLPSEGNFWEFMKKGRDALARFDEDYC